MTLKWMSTEVRNWRGFFSFLSEVNEKERNKPNAISSFLLLQASHTTFASIQIGKFLTSNRRHTSAEISITDHWWHLLLHYTLLFFYILLFFATLGDMIPWLRLRPENWPAYDRRYMKGKVSVIYSHSMQRTQSRLLRVSSRALLLPTNRDRDTVSPWPNESSWQRDLPANSPLVSYLTGSENTWLLQRS